MGQERLGPSYFFIPLVRGPLNTLVWYVPSLRYTRGLGWRMHCGVEVTESSTNKQHHLYLPRMSSRANSATQRGQVEKRPRVEGDCRVYTQHGTSRSALPGQDSVGRKCSSSKGTVVKHFCERKCFHCKHRWMGRDFAPAEENIEKRRCFEKRAYGNCEK